jgi:transcriptional regulator with XRE-family HTH domain
MAITLSVKIGRRIRLLRTSKGLTQPMLADHAELTTVYISELERGKKSVTVGALARIAQALDVKLEEFFKGM